MPSFILEDTKIKLSELNVLLQKKCADLSLKIEYYKNMNENNLTNESLYNYDYLKTYGY